VNPRPTVSVVIPVYNAERFLAEAIAGALKQTRPPAEIVVVDDGSTDRSADVAVSFPGVRVIRQANTGPAAARNAGVAAARGDCVAFLDADDVWLPTKLERQAAALACDPAPDVVFGHMVEFADVAAGAPAVISDRAAAPVPAPVPSAALVTRAALERVGPFDATLKLGDFIDWVSRAADLGLVLRMVPDLVVRRRIHASNLGRAVAGDPGDYLRLVRRAMLRRRASSAGRAAPEGRP
jgi:glycosyltransferase involved in cell wall biosynthesis